jgi:hypothetical protein
MVIYIYTLNGHLFLFFSDKWTPLKLVKRALGFFLHSKSRINKSHEYALVILHNSAKWVRL